MEVATVYTLRQFSTPSVPEETLVIPEITTVTALGSLEPAEEIIEYQRYQQLYSQGAVSASQRDSKELNLATAQEQLAEAKATLNRIKTTKQQQIAEARAT